MEQKYLADISPNFNFTTAIDAVHDEKPADNRQPHKVGRRQAIPDHLVPVAKQLMEGGLGYRRAAHVLREEHGLRLHWSRLRDLRTGRGCYAKFQEQPDQGSG